jgi:hypothetical protein
MKFNNALCFIAMLVFVIPAPRVCGQGTLLLQTTQQDERWRATLSFSNRLLPEIDAPVFHSDCVTPLAGNEFMAVLYAGPEGSLEAELVQVLPPTPFRTGQFAGYWVPQWTQEFFLGDKIAAQARVWEAKAGSFEAAQAGAGLYGSSKVVGVHLTGTPTGLPDALHGLESFCLVPEPAPVWLWAGGGIVLGFLALRRRRQGEAASGTMRPK